MRAAIIGCGVIARNHLAVLSNDPRVSVRWVCDPDYAAAAAVAPEVPHAYDLAEVLLDPAVDVVHICTPHATHKGQVLAALAAGKHVICEKPLATTPGDLRAICAAAERAGRDGRVAACIFQHRYGVLAQALAAAIAAGAFGELRAAALDFRCTRGVDYYAAGAWRGTWHTEGGGVCINQALHAIDLLLWLCGSPVRSVAATCQNRHLPTLPIEDRAEARVTLDSGLAVDLVVDNNQVDDWEPWCSITGSAGSIRFTLNDNGSIDTLEHGDAALVAELRAAADTHAAVGPTKACYGDLHGAQIRDCYDAIAGGTAPRVGIADGAQACEAVLAIYHAAATGATVELPLPDRHRVPRLHPAG